MAKRDPSLLDASSDPGLNIIRPANLLIDEIYPWINAMRELIV